MNKTENWALYICRACGLIYDESKGDEDSGLAAGTRFEDIPEDWACPLCGVTKADFELYTDAGERRGRDALSELEQFRHVFATQASGRNISPLPVRLFLRSTT